jgi:hypothetical protein
MNDSTSRREALKQAALGGVALLALPLPVVAARGAGDLVGPAGQE